MKLLVTLVFALCASVAFGEQSAVVKTPKADLTFEFSDYDVVLSVTLAEITEALEMAVRMIGPVNEAPDRRIEFGDLLYRYPPKPSEDLRDESKALLFEAEALEQKERDLKQIMEVLNKLRRINE